MIRPFFARSITPHWKPANDLGGNWYYYDEESRQMYGLAPERKTLAMIAVAGIALSGAYLIVRLTDPKRKKR